MSATNLPLGPGVDGDTAELERSVSSLTGSSQGERGRETERERERGRGGTGVGVVETTKSEKPERPERSEKRRSGGSINTTTTTSAAAGAGGRTTPTTGGVPSFAQPTSSSRARQTPSITRGRDRDREENATKDISHYRDTRSRASASTPSLALPELEPTHQRDRERSPSKATTTTATTTSQARTPARRVSLPPTVRTTSPTPTNSHATSRASTPKRAVSPTPIPNESAILDEDEDDVIEVKAPVVVVAAARELENKRRPQAIQLGKGKWPDDFMNAFSSPPSPSRPVAIHRAEAENTLSSNTQSSPLVITKNNNTGSSPISVPHRPMHRPRHSIDAPILRPKNQSPSPDGVHARIVPRRHSTSANRHGIYIPRSNSPSPDVNGIGLGLGNASGGTSVPFPRAVSGEHAAASPGLGIGIGVGVIAGASPSEVSATAAAATAAQQSRLTRGRFQSEVDAGTRGRPRPNSYDELGGGRPRRSRIESMVSIGGASSSNFSASDIRSSMDGGNVRKTLIIKDEGRPATHFVSKHLPLPPPPIKRVYIVVTSVGLLIPILGIFPFSFF